MNPIPEVPKGFTRWWVARICNEPCSVCAQYRYDSIKKQYWLDWPDEEPLITWIHDRSSDGYDEWAFPQ